MTQETGFFSDHTFPISAVVAEADEDIELSFDQFLDIDTIDTSDSEEEYKDFQVHKGGNKTAFSSNSEHRISLTT